MRSQVLIATLAVAVGVQADVTSSNQLLPLGKQQQQPQALPPRPGQQQPPPPRAGTPTQINQPQPQQGGLLGNLLGKNNQPPPGQQPPPQQGGLLGGLLNKNNQPPPGGPAPKQPGGLLGNLGNKQPNQPGGLLGNLGKQPNQGPSPKGGPGPLGGGGLLGGGGIGGLLGGLAGPAGPVTHPIAIKACPPSFPCRGRNNACVPHPSTDGQFLCVKVDDDCGGRRGKACPQGQACLADPRDRDACVNGWCNNNEGICVAPPGGR